MYSKTALIFDQHANWYARELGNMCKGYEFVATADYEQALDRANEADILIGLAPYIKPDLISAMPKLQWLQALTTGVDNLLAMDVLSKDVIVTNCSGFHGPQMSELTLLLMLSLSRKFPTMLENQKSAIWQRWPQPLLAGKTACLVGLGAIAETLSKRCQAMEMRVTGVSDGRTQLDGFDRIYKRSEIDEAASDADFLIVIVPYSEKTHHIINSSVLAAAKQSAFLINISRGGCVDEQAMMDALDAGSIAGAGMDVFATEPLPQDNPIWRHPKIIVTPHIGGMADIYHQQALPLVAQNLNSFAKSGVVGLTGRIDR